MVQVITAQRLSDTGKQMARASKQPLPKYAAPPIVETVLGVEFSSIEKWALPYFGVFWKQVKDEFPKFAVKPPLDSQIERFDGPKPAAGTRIQLLSEPEIRCWFIDGDDRTLIQVQSNRFTYNWRKTGPADIYPHFDENIRPAFERIWRQFTSFVGQEQLGEVSVTQCEVTYVNHLEIGKGWNSAADLPEVFPCWSGKTSGAFLPSPENVSFDISYRLPEDSGRLRVSAKPAIRNQDGAEIIQLTLTARCRPTSGDMASVLGSIDWAREWVVRGFTEVTSDQMHAVWQRKS